MHTAKFNGASSCRNVCNEHQRESETYKNFVDQERSQWNFNVCPHEPFDVPQYVSARLQKKPRKDAVLMFDTVITLPRDFSGNTRQFFEMSYKGLKKIYNLSDNEVVSAIVHLDETTPHMHFCAVPITQDNRLCYKDIVPREVYQTQHRELQQYLKENGIECKIAKTSAELEKAKKEGYKPTRSLEELKAETIEARSEAQIARLKASEYEKDIKHLKSEIEGLKAKIEHNKGVYERNKQLGERILSTMNENWGLIQSALDVRTLNELDERLQELEQALELE